MNLRPSARRHDQAAIRSARECTDAALDLADVAHIDRAQLNPERRRPGLRQTVRPRQIRWDLEGPPRASRAARSLSAVRAISHSDRRGIGFAVVPTTARYTILMRKSCPSQRR
jgi:hypothetical protein